MCIHTEQGPSRPALRDALRWGPPTPLSTVSFSQLEVSTPRRTVVSDLVSPSCSTSAVLRSADQPDLEMHDCVGFCTGSSTTSWEEIDEVVPTATNSLEATFVLISDPCSEWSSGDSTVP